MGLSSVFDNYANDRTIEVDVEGMTCQHCVAHVKEALEGIDGIKNIEVILNPGGLSRVTLVSDIEQDFDKIRQTVADASYTVTDIRRDE